MKAALSDIQHILTHGDARFAFVVLGLACIFWGVLGLVYTPDIQWFAKGFALEVAPWLWGLNHLLFGLALVRVAVANFPPGLSLLVGSYGCMAWTWIALGRPVSSFSSGMTLNLVVILMSVVLVQRSGRQP